MVEKKNSITHKNGSVIKSTCWSCSWLALTVCTGQLTAFCNPRSRGWCPILASRTRHTQCMYIHRQKAGTHELNTYVRSLPGKWRFFTYKGMARDPVAKLATRQQSQRRHGKRVSLQTLLVNAGKPMGESALLHFAKQVQLFLLPGLRKLTNWSCLSRTFCLLVQQTITQ